MFKISRIVFCIILILSLSFFYFAFKQVAHMHRDPEVLMNRYFLLRERNPVAAKRALEVILKQDQQYQPALKELSALYLRENNSQAALPLLLQLHQLVPNDHEYTEQIARIYYDTHKERDIAVLHHALQHSKNHMSTRANQIFTNMASVIPFYQSTSAEVLVKKVETQNPSLLSDILLSYFYKLKSEAPLEAEEYLAVMNILLADKPLIYEERGYLALQKHDQQAAIDYFQSAYYLRPSARLALQLGYLYYNIKDEQQAAWYFLIASATADPDILEPALKASAFLRQSQAKFLETSPLVTLVTTPPARVSRETQLMNEFYTLKKTNKAAAWHLIQKITTEFPGNILALREAGYFALNLDKKTAAIDYFTRAYALTYATDLALQLGYLYDLTPDKNIAYRYFSLATKSLNKEEELKAQNAMTNLAGLQTKAFPEPYFAEIFFTPFSQSRFGLTVRPLLMRLGVELDDRLSTRAYLFLRQTDDNKSGNFGQIPQIYEDNVRIIGTGVQISPFKKIPLVAFIEAGGAYDLFYRNRARWRGDLRSGVMYYNEFGARPAYFDYWRWAPDYYSFVYGDITYFSRFNNNVIGTLKTHQGIHLLQYHSLMINLYLSGRIIEDTNRDFFNNIAEIGPGIGIIPSNRYRLELRLEHINGVYLPVGGSQNPYGKYYTNKVAQLLIYARI